MLLGSVTSSKMVDNMAAIWILLKIQLSVGKARKLQICFARVAKYYILIKDFAGFGSILYDCSPKKGEKHAF